MITLTEETLHVPVVRLLSVITNNIAKVLNKENLRFMHQIIQEVFDKFTFSALFRSLHGISQMLFLGMSRPSFFGPIPSQVI